MQINIHHHTNDATLRRVEQLLEILMATLDDVLAEVTKETDEIGSITALINGLRQQVADALASQTIPPPLQAKVDAIFAAAVANNATIVQALNAPGAAPAAPAATPAPPSTLPEVTPPEA